VLFGVYIELYKRFTVHTHTGLTAINLVFIVYVFLLYYERNCDLIGSIDILSLRVFY